MTASAPAPRRPIRKVLIANRGEIAVRIARTCAEMGIGTIAVFSDPDADAVHVAACDEAIRLGGDTPATSYLRQDALLAAAHRTGADAVHPGFGFLAEHAGFAQAVLDAGLVWIGPRPAAIAAMGDKIEAKRRMVAAGVPLLPSEELALDADDAAVQAAGAAVGFPLMVKAAAGGGGKGMRVVMSAADLVDAVAAARREAAGAFGDDRVFLERFVERPRHIEVQILGDEHGNLVHLFERECSIQRRHQKVVEESPSPALTPELRAAICDAAVAAGKSIDYSNAGTVEFVMDDEAARRGDAQPFAFLEVNTRLQVEHPVTEAVTGLDLVRLQLEVAMGEPLPFAQSDVTVTGHAIEVRLYAEDPANDYLPATGTLHAFRPPDDGVRWDAGVVEGSRVSTFYDPMLAKVIAHAPLRRDAAARLARALEDTLLLGVTTNRDLLVHVLRDEAFLAGDTTTRFLEERFPTHDARTFPPVASTAETAAIVATVARWVPDPDSPVPSSVPVGFSNVGLGPVGTTYTVGGHDLAVGVAWRRGGGARVTIDDREVPVPHVAVAGDRVTAEIDGHRVTARIAAAHGSVQVVLPGANVTLFEHPRFPHVRAADEAGATLAPMPGSVVSVAVEEGQQVERGDLLVVVEAMKMEHRITAPTAGTVTSVRVAAGQQVDADEVLVIVREADADDEEAVASD
jgi:propionyl-CoA carboxylase alpha chain